ncbi:hypothetical protein [Mesorhizobium sp. BE184]|uniref:hypothetical protein n=1 Tax=Mesorhizobium sp. BE184 TaxID=2817714 RepID=UPI00285C2F40|nr:hypothetical protein [Mesorhizobium sp. BE184]MDR7033894.1 hypothetical protein [Mesorhizobium sp. BE184]
MSAKMAGSFKLQIVESGPFSVDVALREQFEAPPAGPGALFFRPNGPSVTTAPFQRDSDLEQGVFDSKKQP